jgi:putative peptidoglycan lipid II flippase
MIAVVRILFPMTGVLVLSAWALGILNSHRKFFLPYFAPVLWNAAIIGALIAFGSRLDQSGLLLAAAWGALVGGLLQFGVQLPAVLRLDRQIRINTGRNEPAVQEAGARPAPRSSAAVQLSTYFDMVLATLLASGALARLRYAQTLYVLPVSLFGMSVAAAELPDLARERDAAVGVLRERTVAAVRRVAFYVVPSCVAFVLLGDALVAGLYRAGEFGAADVTVVWVTLIGYSAGLLASTSTRVYQSAFFALRDTATPARAAGVRVLTALVVGAVLMVQFESVTLLGLTIPAGVFADVRLAGIPLGPLGLAVGASVGAWVEWALLWRALAAQLGSVGAGMGPLARMLGAALVAAAAARGLFAVVALAPLPSAALVAALFGAVYCTAAHLLGLGEARVLAAALLRRTRPR